jgi:hypothetical protein
VHDHPSEQSGSNASRRKFGDRAKARGIKEN